MKNHFVKFLIALSVISIVTITVARLFFEWSGREVPTGFYLPFLFFFVTTLIIYKAVTYASENQPKRFPAYFMGGTTIKLLGGLAFLVVYAFRYPAHVKTFFVLFLIIYMIFTSFEVVSILRHLRDKKSASQQ